MTTPALNPADVAVALTGHVYVAPVGSTAPTDVTTAWDAAFVDLGYISDAGVKMDPSIDFTDIPVWQDIFPVRSVPKSSNQTFQFQCVATNPGVLDLYLPDATVTATTTLATINVPSVPDSDFRMFGFEWDDGGDIYRLVLPRGLVKTRSAVQLARTSAMTYDMTVTAYSNGTAVAYSLLTNHASLLSSS